jgi:hypothetical protein
MNNRFTPIGCGTDCAALPTFTVGDCNPVKSVSEISMILFSKQGWVNNPTSIVANELVPGFKAEYLDRVSNTSTDADAVRFKTVFAELPAADPDTVTDEYGTKIPKWSNRQITFVDSDMSPENYLWHEKAQCMGEIRFWYVIDGYLYGGKNGLKATFYSSQSSTQGADTISNKFDCTISFRMTGIIPRALSYV